MDATRVVVLVAATILTISGVAVIAARELANRDQRRPESPFRDFIEIATPAIGAIVLVLLVWRLV